MKKGDYKRERKKLEDTKIRLETELSSVNRKLNALDVVWTEVFHHNTQNGQETSENCGGLASEAIASPAMEEPIELRVPANGHTAQYVEEAVEKLTAPFKVKDVIETILTEHPEITVNNSTVAGKLAKLLKHKRIKITRLGMGRTPSIYEKVGEQM